MIAAPAVKRAKEKPLPNLQGNVSQHSVPNILPSFGQRIKMRTFTSAAFAFARERLFAARPE
jgi:hypothetical protein